MSDVQSNRGPPPVPSSRLRPALSPPTNEDNNAKSPTSPRSRAESTSTSTRRAELEALFAKNSTPTSPPLQRPSGKTMVRAVSVPNGKEERKESVVGGKNEDSTSGVGNAQLEESLNNALNSNLQLGGGGSAAKLTKFFGTNPHMSVNKKETKEEIKSREKEESKKHTILRKNSIEETKPPLPLRKSSIEETKISQPILRKSSIIEENREKDDLKRITPVRKNSIIEDDSPVNSTRESVNFTAEPDNSTDLRARSMSLGSALALDMPSYPEVEENNDSMEYWKKNFYLLVGVAKEREKKYEERIQRINKEKADLIAMLEKTVPSLTKASPSRVTSGVHSPPSSTQQTPVIVTRERSDSIQRTGYVAEVAPENETPEEKKKRIFREVVREIIRTETEYVSDLEVLNDVYLEPISTKNPKILNPAENESFELLVSNMTGILGLNREFLKDLKTWEEKVKEGTREYGEIGDFFSKYAQFFKSYAAYCACQDTFRVTVLEKASTKNKTLYNFLETGRADPRCRKLSLVDFLIMPMQRICRYPLLLKELVKNYDEDGVHFAPIQSAFNKISSVVVSVNEKKGEMENMERMRNISECIEGLEKETLLDPRRQMVKEGDLNRVIENGKSEEVHLFLFNDILIVAKPVRKNAWALRTRFDLSHIQLRELSTVSFELNCLFTGRKMKLFSETPEVKEDWIEMILHCIAKLRKGVESSFVSASNIKRMSISLQHDGILSKLTHGNWKPRYFVLKDGVLYRSDVKGGKIKAKLSMTPDVSIEDYTKEEGVHAFVIRCGKAQTVLRANDEFDLHEWLNALFKHKLLGDTTVEKVVEVENEGSATEQNKTVFKMINNLM